MKKITLILLLTSYFGLYAQEEIIETKPLPLKYISVNNIQQEGITLSNDQIREVLKTQKYALEDFNKGIRNRKIGNIFLGGGIGLFVGNGISNLMFANNDKSSKNPQFLFIVGGGIAATGIIIKISAKDRIKESVWHYNQRNGFTSKTNLEFNLAANSDGVGVQLNF